MADSSTYSPETIYRRQKIADQLLMQAVKPREIRHWAQGLGQLGEAALAGYEGHRANEDEKQSRAEAVAQALAAFDRGGPSASSSPMPMAAPPTRSVSPVQEVSPGDFNSIDALASPAGKFDPNYASTVAAVNRATASVESGGNYGALGPETGGDRAYGKHQVMGKNIGPWTKEVTGQELTPEQFLQKPDTQDAVFNSKFGGNVQKYGNVTDPASIWFSGKPQAEAGNRSDVTGTTVPSYIQKVSAALGGPQQVAQNAPTPGQTPPPQNKQAAIAALLNPWTPPQLAGALAGQINPTYGFQTLPDGTIVRTNPRTGTVEPTYQAPTKSTFGKIGQNRDGQDIYGFINPEKGTAVPVQAPGTAGASGAPDSGVTGDEFLKSLNDPGRADLIKGMVEGRMAPAQMGRFGTQAVQSLLKDAARYEPGFDMTKWGARASTAKDFASGMAAKNVTSLNTVIGHLGDLAEKADALDNFGGYPLVNKSLNEAKNWMAVNSGKPEVKNFNLARNAVADEMAKVFRGSGLSDAETRQWKENISAAGSPEELRGAISTAIGLMESRLNAMGEQRNKGMSTQTEPMALLTDKSRATLDKVKRWSAGEKSEPASAPAIDPGALEEARKRGLI